MLVLAPDSVKVGAARTPEWRALTEPLQNDV
jgi:hypothetical protein